MILAAGRGERMRPLTDATPKPLLKAGGRALIEYHVEALVAAGFRCLVINHALLGALIERHLGAGDKWGACIHYSPEGEPLETGGGIYRALTLLKGPFLVVNADVWSDIDYASLRIADNDIAHLVLVENPPHHPRGDFCLAGGRVSAAGDVPLTFSGVGIYRKQLFAGCGGGRFPLAPVLRDAIARGAVGGRRHEGAWMDIGTPERLNALDRTLQLRR